jgi:DNA-directed RNA polymerase
MTPQDRQLHLERESINRGMERMREQLAADVMAGRAAENPVGQAQLARLVERTVDGVKRLQLNGKRALRKGMTTGQRLSGWELPLCMMDVDVTTYITIHTMFNSAMSGEAAAETKIAKKIGEVCNLQLRYNQLRSGEKERVKEGGSPSYNRIEIMKREVKAVNPRSVKKWLRKMSDVETDIWPVRTRLAVGFQLLQAILEQCPDIFERVEHMEGTHNGPKTRVRIGLTEHAQQTIEKRMRGMGMNMPWMLPMVCEPTPWSAEDNGGYLTIPRDFVKAHHDNLYEEEVMPMIYEAVNVVQNTRWSINPRVFAVARKAVEEGHAEILPVPPVAELPPEVSDEEWQGMDKKAKSALKLKRKLIHENNFKMDSRRRVVQRQLEVAGKFADEPIVYFPHCLDFRGRAYPLTQDLHPQADDFGKALLWFADAKPLDDAGFLWMQYQVASTYGLDKLDRDQQLDWCNTQFDKLQALVSDPFNYASLCWWAEADEPWQFFAAACELVKAVEHGEGYMCHLPVTVDGSCNGLQHLSAMGLDKIGAFAVNLTSEPQRQDIYGLVAEKIEAKLPGDSDWVGRVSRKVVKRGVMTTPYGLTHVGMRDQLIKDRPKCWGDTPGDPLANATEMRDLMSTSISETVVASVEIMNWMQECAGLLADHGQGIRWTAPTGFMVNQFYPQSIQRAYTIVGVGFKTNRKRYLAEYIPGIRKSKQVLAIAPNIVHSFDAAHMTMAVSQANAEGLTDSFVVVHDSFGVHPSDMDRFLEIIKDQFINIYSVDVLETMYTEFQAQAPEGVTIPSPPLRGEFNIEEVRQSPFFFA